MPFGYKLETCFPVIYTSEHFEKFSLGDWYLLFHRRKTLAKMQARYWSVCRDKPRHWFILTKLIIWKLKWVVIVWFPLMVFIFNQVPFSNKLCNLIRTHHAINIGKRNSLYIFFYIHLSKLFKLMIWYFSHVAIDIIVVVRFSHYYFYKCKI